MSDQFVGEIRLFAGTFAPTGWALCNGQLLPINQNTALFSLLGTTYGGDGRSTFALPDFTGRMPMHPGNAAGLTGRLLGERGGSASVTLEVSQCPAHTHALMATDAATSERPTRLTSLAVTAEGRSAYRNDSPRLVAMATESLSASGGSQPHNNQSPALTMNFIIALQGIYPPRS